jgi:hypothetical protein
MTTEELVKAIQWEIEYLQTSEGDEIECISIENLEGILNRFLNKPIKLTQE